MARKGDVRKAVVEFVRNYYARHKKVPSVRLICRRHKQLGLTRSNFYDYFRGLPEACRAAEVPVPNRVKFTKRALKARKVESFEGIKLLEQKVERLAEIVAYLGDRIGDEQLIFEDECWDELWERYKAIRIERK